LLEEAQISGLSIYQLIYMGFLAIKTKYGFYGETLLEHIGRKILSLYAKLEIAVDLTRILGKIHEHNVIHLDLNSKNILIGNEHQAVHLIDLSAALRITSNFHQKVGPDQMMGTLPYISPEQTGRIVGTCKNPCGTISGA